MTENTPEPKATPETAGIHEAARREKMRKLVALGIDPWGQRFDDHQRIGDIRAREAEIVTKPLAEGQRHPDQTGPRVRAAGRIVLHRNKGKLHFIDLRDWTGKVQVMIGRAQVGEEVWAVVECLDLGDLIGVDGELRRTNTGELTIFADKITFLTKSVEPHPEKHHGLVDPELRQRMRYLDLIYTEGSLDRFLNRTKIIHSIRQTLAGNGYVEIEGPTLHSIAGGAAARPFKTHHNALDMPLFLRIALELHLKRLMVGGMERVYEMGRVYRNEGVSPRHNPEFTMIELYQAYANYRTMMDLAEQIICNALKATGQSLQVKWGETTLDFTPPFKRRTYNDLFSEYAGVDPNDPKAVHDKAIALGLDTAGKHPDVVKSEVFEETVEDALMGPIFVIDYPSSICPLTKRKTSDPSVAERFELFVHGMELANAYTELNDPDLQERLFSSQLEGQREEDSMAKMDHDFIRALRYGMPPAGGMGIGIDRLIMLLTNAQTIRDVILFPLLRHEAE